MSILTLCEKGDAILVSSDVLVDEVSRCPIIERREYAEEVLKLAHPALADDATIEARAKDLVAGGFKAFDAYHLATAEAAEVDRFCTCDDRLLKKARLRADIAVQVCSPLELAEEILP